MRKIAMYRPPLWIVVVVMCLTLSFGTGVGYVRGQEANTGNCPEAKDVCTAFSDFWKVWDLAKDQFVDPKAIKPDQMTAGAINGMLDSLGDQGHTRYLTAEQVKRFNESIQGSFEGIGAFVNTNEAGQPIIVSPIEGSPAEAAGVRSGDIILKVNGKATEGLVLDEVVNQIRGPRGSSVTITVRHVGEEASEDLTIKRAAVTIPSTSFVMLPDHVAFIRLTQFSDNADVAMQQRIQEARTAGARALILDVRDNPGGLLKQAVNVTGVFLPKGSTVLREEHRDTSEQVYTADNPHPESSLPIVVLINSGSASSAEIFAGALQDYGRATLIGIPTAGTGTVLNTISLNDGSAVLMGTAQWRTPKGRYLRREGVSPDLTVALPAGVRPIQTRDLKNLDEAALLQTKDTQLLRALNLLGVTADRGDGPSRFVAR